MENRSSGSGDLLAAEGRASWRLIVSVALMLAGLLAWAAFSEIDTLARAQGQVITVARTLVIQSANDGVIESLLVREGDQVRKDDILARLNRAQPEAAWQDSQGKVAALKASLARLQAEVFGRPLRFPPEVSAYPMFISNQTELFQRRQSALREEVKSLEFSLALVRKQLELSLPLLGTGDISKVEIINLQKQVSEISGQITNRRNKYFQDAQAEMTKAEEDLATQEQLLNDRTAVYDRTEILAPADGIVRNILMTTPGAKVRPGDVILELVPSSSTLVFEAKLRPADIAFVAAGMPAAVKLDAYDYAIYGVLHERVSYVSPDALFEKTLNGEQSYFRVHVSVSSNGLRHNDQRIGIGPGMTGSVDIRTGKQTVLRYLTKPLTRTFAESLHER